MIGQKKLLNKIDTMIEKRTFPQFSIIEADEGMGKHTICEYISTKLNKDIIYIDPKIDGGKSTKNKTKTTMGIREMTKLAEEYTSLMFVLEDAEEGSLAYKNSMLKVIEEPPKHCFIILLTSNRQQLLPTILSRGILFELEPYTLNELKQFSEDQLKINIMQNPGMLIKYQDFNLQELKDYCDKILLKIKGNSLGNCLKIPLKLDLDTESKKKERDETKYYGYDPLLFLLTLKYCNSQLRSNIDLALKVDTLISIYKNLLLLRFAINKKFLMDEFIIKLYLLFKEN